MSLLEQDVNEIISHLMNEHDLTRSESVKEFKEMKKRVKDGECPEELLYDIGLEPDYVLALI